MQDRTSARGRSSGVVVSFIALGVYIDRVDTIEIDRVGSNSLPPPSISKSTYLSGQSMANKVPAVMGVEGVALLPIILRFVLQSLVFGPQAFQAYAHYAPT